MKYIYYYEGYVVLETNDIKPLNEVVEVARQHFAKSSIPNIDETKITCYQKIY